MRRILLISAVSLVAVFIAAVGALPWWLEPVLRRVGNSWSSHFGVYERIGYTRFALHDVEVRQAGVLVTATRVESETPVLWLWHRMTGHPEEIRLDRWTVTVEDRKSSAVGLIAEKKRGWLPLRAVLMRVARGLDQWIPRAKIGAGEVHWFGGGLTIESAIWEKRTLSAGKVRIGSVQARVTLVFPRDKDQMDFTVLMDDASGKAHLESRGDKLAGELSWWGQKAELKANFAEKGWLPLEASLHGDSWSLPGAQLKVGELYGTVQGHGKMEWREGRFDFEIVANGEPLASKSGSPLDARLRGHGDTQTFTVDILHAQLPGISAELSEPVTIDYQGRFRKGTAHFALKADLTKQPWFEAKGQLSGEAAFSEGIAQTPVIVFSFETHDLEIGKYALKSASTNGCFTWPRIEVLGATITMKGGEAISAHGAWNFQTKEVVDAAIDGQVRRSTLAPWLPEQPDFETLVIKAQVSGPPSNLTHSGSVEGNGVKLRGFNPLAVAITWRGRGAIIDDFTAVATAGSSKASVTGAATHDELRFSGMNLSKGDKSFLSLAAPAIIRWKPSLQIEALHLVGSGEVNLAVSLGKSGRLDFALRKMSSTWFEEWVALPGPAWQVSSLNIIGAWNDGPLAYSASADLSIALGKGRLANVVIEAKGDQNGLAVDQFLASEDTAPIFSMTGRLPMVLYPGASPRVRIDSAGTLVVETTTAPNKAFWEKLAALTGISIEGLEASAHVTGSWEHPIGDVRVSAARIQLDPLKFKRQLPEMELLDVMLTGDRDGLKLERLSVNLEGQQVKAQGKLAVVDDAWKALLSEPFTLGRRSADLHLEIPDADLAAFARFLPAYLVPKGRLHADLEYTHGGIIEGALKLQDAATRPLGPLGVLQEINADVQITGSKAEFRSVTAKAGGQPVSLGGTIQYSEGLEPRYDVTLHGENLPFIRQTGLLVRGDVDLKLRTSAIGKTAISGTVRLRDSLFLSDVRAFLPGGTRSGSHQPPYFEVLTPPFDAWTLGVDVSGERFMRLRTPLFNGVASVRFHLGGTLGEPRATGEVRIDEGLVMMPFANFVVKQGSLRITEENPHELELFLRGTGRRIGYDLTMEITGTAQTPNIMFTSSPALDSEQLLLMIMTGAAPSNQINYSRSQRFARLGTYLGQSLLGSYSGDANSVDRLSIATGEKVSRQGRETYDVEYKLSDRWKWVGEYDEFDDTNIGLKWRFYPGKRAPEAPRDASK